MNKKILILIVGILILAAGIGAYFVFQKPASEPQTEKCGDGICVEQPKLKTFFVIHAEPQTPEKYYNDLIDLVALADKYDVKLTILLTAQWANYISNDPQKIQTIKDIYNNGHEIGYHHHPVNVPNGPPAAWDGYTNNPGFENHPGYIGTMQDYISEFEKLGIPMTELKTATMGTLYEGNEMPLAINDWLCDMKYEVESKDMSSNLAIPEEVNRNKCDVWHMNLGGFIVGNKKWVDEVLKKQYEENKDNDSLILGAVHHVFDYTDYIKTHNDNPTEEWFKFLKEENAKRMTVSEILDNLK